MLISVIFIAGCGGSTNQDQSNEHHNVVQIIQTGNDYQLFRNGEPYYVKGAGGYSNFEELKARGGNSVRVWDTNDAGRILDEAHKHGLTVCLGIWMTREREGFDYDDKYAVERQFEHIKREVMKYKDHPALLMWDIGNEVNAEYTNVRVWDAVNQVAKMIHEVDPHHPTTISLFDVHQRTVRLVKQRCPDIDILSVNAYGGIQNLPEKIRASAWDGPYLITEFGSKGDWESYQTDWHKPIEQTSSQKAHFIREKYENHILRDSTLNLGSYVFIWGQKQEQTHTWFSLFSKAGEKTEMVDMMQYLWTGEWPDNRAPHVLGLYVNGELVGEYGKTVKPKTFHTAELIAYDQEGDSLTYHWEILPEVNMKDGAVDRLKKPDPVKVIMISNGATLQWQAPEEEGEYRLFATVSDGNNSIGTANLAFRVKGRLFEQENNLIGTKEDGTRDTVILTTDQLLPVFNNDPREDFPSF